MPEVIPSLIRCGLSPDADLVYRTLVLSGPSSVTELCRMVGLSPARVRAALDALGSRGIAMAISSSGRSETIWAGRSPRETAQMLEFRPGFLAFVMAEGNPAAIRRIPQARTGQHMAGLFAQAHQEILAMGAGHGFDLDHAKRSVPVLRQAQQRYVSVRSISLHASVGTPLSREELEILLGHSRQIEHVPGTILITDRRTALVNSPTLPSDWLEISDPVLVEALVALYERYWTDSASQIPLTPRQHAVVALLVQGHTDETIGRRLQLSRRTVAGEVRALMDTYDVTGRLQLGVVLAKHHWTR